MIQALLDGYRRVRQTPMLVGAVYIVTLLTTIPLALALHNSIATHLGRSVAADAVADGVDWVWWEEFRAQAEGFEQTFSPSIIGAAAVLGNLSRFVDRDELPGAIVVVAVCYVAVSLFLVGGILDRLARQRRVSVAHFFATSGTYFARFVRLMVPAGVAYWLLIGPFHGWLFDDLYVDLTRDITVERTGFVLRVALYAVFLVPVLFVNLLFDYAKIRAVVEDRRSMVGALLAAVRFVRRRPTATIGLYLLNGAIVLSVMASYAAVAPGAGGSGPSVWLALLLGQLYVAARAFTKLLFYASQTAYFQSQLAHATYVATPQPVWPESPAAEAIVGAPPQH